jgi:alkanesulfonate monooxygenase SsuD/methylene tetrahydromethanopterin reductase-like flavin-dependent oxidoreductase (luciferase family)
MKPVRKDVPIYVAALKKNAIRTIGELADGWIPTFWPFEKLSVGRAWVEEGARKAGRDPASIVTAPFMTVIPMGAEMGGEKAREVIAFYIGGMGEYYRELLEGFGYKDECARVAELYRDRATRKQAAAAVTPAMIEALTIAGDPQHCIEELRRRRAHGIDIPIINLPIGVPWELVEMFIRAMAPQA